MSQSDPHDPIPFPLRNAIANTGELDSAQIASRVIEFLLAVGGPQERFAVVADCIAESLSFAPGVAAEVRTFGQEVSSLSPSAFANLQDLAWADCSGAHEVDEHTAHRSSPGEPAPD